MATLEDQLLAYKRRLARRLEKAGRIVEGEMHDIVAIKTGKLDRSIRTDRVIDRGNILSVDVGANKVDYAKFVETGVKNRVYTYRRKGQPVWVGVGQQWAGRSLDNTRNEVKNMIQFGI